MKETGLPDLANYKLFQTFNLSVKQKKTHNNFWKKWSRPLQEQVIIMGRHNFYKRTTRQSLRQVKI